MSSASLFNELKNEGFNLKQPWLDNCIQSKRIHSRNIILQQLLCTDIRDWCEPFIPNNLNTYHKQTWNGKYILQIDEIINLCLPSFEDKNKDPLLNPKLLRLKLTEGHSYIYAMIYQPINDLNLLTPLNSKIAIQNVFIRRGILILTNANSVLLKGTKPPENTEQKSNNNDNNNNSNNRNNNNNNNNDNVSGNNAIHNNNNMSVDVDDDIDILNNNNNNNNRDNNRNRRRNADVNINNNNNNRNNNMNNDMNNSNSNNNNRNDRNNNNSNNNRNNDINNRNNNRRNIAITYDNNDTDSFLIRDNQNVRSMNMVPKGLKQPRKLTQSEKLCGFGSGKQESIFIKPAVIRQEKEKLERNEMKKNVNNVGEWTCTICTFDNKNRPNGICELCNNVNEEDKENNNNINNNNNNNSNNNNSNNNNSNDNNNKKQRMSIDNEWNCMEWEDDTDLTNMTFDDFLVTSTNTNSNKAKKRKSKKKKFDQLV